MLRQLAVIAAALVIVAAFFLPWMNGSNELDQRTFSGFDFARLIRNFEITAESPSTTGQLRATALLLYLVPALAVNAGILYQLARVHGSWRRSSSAVLVLTAGYVCVVVAALLVLSSVSVNRLADLIGQPSYGLALTTGGSFLLGCVGITELRAPAGRAIAA